MLVQSTSLGAGCCLAQQRLELGEHLLNWV